MTSKLTRLTDDELTETLRQATSGYPLPASVEGNLRHAFAELQERLKADSEPVAYIDKQWTLVYYIPPMSMGLKIGDKLYRHAQQPVVPKIATADDFGGLSIAKAYGWNACRAAMLAAAPHDTHALNSLQSVDSVADRWIPVSERMPETDGNYWGWWSESKRQGPVWFIKSELQAQFQSHEITHWMPLPAGPQEVKGE
ncbi:DUF551 domain-containing protein [Raoultella ornithinolytica]|uniref:DUF551 domain-containing protein n=1 Tax=Raoultella ornithinolytica TaxID=54291 RepID=UPI0010DD31E8|nr:DUF551 domain-containing protein [Raoultella ornithinolytica]VTN44904.1 Protein of uncharacterised function (DUF551) [Raoultella ornithinolytica]